MEPTCIYNHIHRDGLILSSSDIFILNLDSVSLPINNKTAITDTIIKELNMEDNSSSRRKVKKKRLVRVSTTMRPLKSTSLDAKKLEESVLSPEDWLERFYNGKSLLRKASNETLWSLQTEFIPS